MTTNRIAKFYNRAPAESKASGAVKLAEISGSPFVFDRSNPADPEWRRAVAGAFVPVYAMIAVMLILKTWEALANS